MTGIRLAIPNLPSVRIQHKQSGLANGDRFLLDWILQEGDHDILQHH